MVTPAGPLSTPTASSLSSPAAPQGPGPNAPGPSQGSAGGQQQQGPLPPGVNYGDFVNSKYLPYGEAEESRLKTLFYLLPEGWPHEIYPGGQAWIPTQIGEGGGGIAHLWLKYRDGKIVDRTVVKTVLMSQHTRTKWTNWWGNPRDRTTKRVPMEMELLRDRPGSAKVVHSRAHHVDDEGRFYKLYMNYCLYGDLFQVIGIGYGCHSPEDVPIPEAVIWMIFKDLTEACLLLEYGDATAKTGVPDWTPIVHRDLKVDNIVIDQPNPDADDFPAFPTARTMDFGFAVMTDKDDPENPIAYECQGTAGWYAPEQHHWLHHQHLYKFPRPEDKMQLTQATNVWGLGAVVLRLMNQDCLPDAHLFSTPEPEHITVDPYVAPRYSKELRDLVEHCTQYFPKDRPTLLDLKASIDRYTTPGTADDGASGMRTNPNVPADPAFQFRHMKDGYKLQLSG
ncbi:uncharacterized protein LTR77_004075 [Saxophila tyrrhenica]|uniref:non-specific serine/threonine protein kinase n=1 Tax=Saxophila tyrrhenica TaxID=1690608 RepID=A0AAV9PCK7_9PEZI|nr:hypothetical protein LTR77_004075 [Saxophila tyrrhenica]